MRKIILLSFLIAIASFGSAAAQAPSGAGLWRVETCTQIQNPVQGSSFCFERSSNTVKKWTGAAWVDLVSIGTGVISINGQVGDTQVFVNDTNVQISSDDDTHSIVWAGQLAIARGGTAASSAAAARTNLGLVIGTDVQAQGNYITALTGDVTASGPGSSAATIGAGKVVNSMLAGSIATSKLGVRSGAGGTVVVSDGVPADGCAEWSSGNLGSTETACGAGGGGAPTDATYITSTASGGLSSEFALADLATGLLRNTTGTGVPSIAVEGTHYYAPGGTDVALGDGGTGASTASGARTNLGLAIGTDVQAFDSDLAALAANSSTGLWARTGAGTGTARVITGTTNEVCVTNGDGVSGNPTLSLCSTVNLSTKSVLRVPVGVGLATSQSGQIGYDSTANQWHLFVNAADRILPYRSTTTPTDGNCSQWGASGLLGESAVPCTPPGFIPEVLFANLPVGLAPGTVRFVTNTDDSGCNGNGATTRLCRWTGSAWVLADAADAVIPSDSIGPTEIDEAANYEFAGLLITETLLENLPAPALPAGRFRWVTDCESITLCADGLAETRVLHYDDGTEWVPLFPANTTPTIDQTFDASSDGLITGATEAKPAGIRGDSSFPTTGWDRYVDSAGVPQFQCVINGERNICNYYRTLAAGKKAGYKDPDGNIDFEYTADTGQITAMNVNAETAGVTITAPDEDWFEVASCQNATAQLIFNTNTAAFPVAVCEGTNTRLATADFDDTTDEGFDLSWRLPTGFTGAIDIIFRGKMAVTTGAVGLCAQLVRIPTGATSDPALPAQAAGNCVSATVAGTTLQEFEGTIPGVTCTSCVAGDRVNVHLSRDSNGSAVTDSAEGDYKMLGFVRRWRVAK